MENNLKGYKINVKGGGGFLKFLENFFLKFPKNFSKNFQKFQEKNLFEVEKTKF